MRVGIGYDVHQLVEGYRCILGGVEIPHEKGLKGYSDADVLLHAVCDALLGAAGEGDLGRHFPEGDPRWKGISSLRLLEEVASILLQKKYSVINIDAVIIAEKPKIAPFVEPMKANIGRCVSIDPADVSIKATTNEKIGFIGRGEGIAAQAVCLIEHRK
ncbi:MAG: 2-C-methyl-D-erythritol 2,4-cyclodiphosphate synthase [Candidatus Manganitrophaceae bacterium]|nr:MAG: 2-C-methyl-D-erythritol 2,4-cyclodiphosphate synthase [Candidatus Manganitrophaceae bacterium]